VLIADRIGVLRDIAAAISDNGGNIDGISQTVVANYFTVILTATFKSNSPDCHFLQQSLLSKFADNEASIVVREYSPLGPPLAGIRTDKYIIVIKGKDKPGILYRMTEIISKKHINIEDWYVEFKDNFVTHIGEITVPSKLNILQLHSEINNIIKPLGFNCYIQHCNIFRVTNEVGPVKMLLEDRDEK